MGSDPKDSTSRGVHIVVLFVEDFVIYFPFFQTSSPMIRSLTSNADASNPNRLHVSKYDFVSIREPFA